MQLVFAGESTIAFGRTVTRKWWKSIGFCGTLEESLTVYETSPTYIWQWKKKNILVELDWLSESRLFQSNFICNFRSLNVGYQYKTSIYMKLYLNTAIFKCINLHIKNAERVHFQPLELICHDNQGVTYNQNANAIF